MKKPRLHALLRFALDLASTLSESSIVLHTFAGGVSGPMECNGQNDLCESVVLKPTQGVGSWSPSGRADCRANICHEAEQKERAIQTAHWDGHERGFSPWVQPKLFVSRRNSRGICGFVHRPLCD